MEHSQQLNSLLSLLDSLLDGVSPQKGADILNRVSEHLQQYTPFSFEPISNIRWIDASSIQGNSYNPNNMAPPELNLLHRSLMGDGLTQPLVVRQKGRGGYELVDGFHRHYLCLENKALNQRLNGFVPVVVLKEPRGRAEDIAATIRHNRARGRHQIQAMSAVVSELYRLGWDEARISAELGMEPDEVLRLHQIDGLGELFHRRSFSRAWTVE